MFGIFKRLNDIESEIKEINRQNWIREEDKKAKYLYESELKLKKIGYDVTCYMDNCVKFYKNRGKENEDYITVNHKSLESFIAINEFLSK